MPDSLVFNIIPINESGCKSLHNLLYWFFIFLNKQMNMITHKAISE